MSDINRSVNVFFNEAELSAAYDRATTNAAKLEEKMGKIADKASPEFKKLQDQLTATNSKIEQFSGQISGKYGPTIKQMEDAVRKLNNEYKNMAQGSDAANKKLAEIAKAEQALNKARLQVKAVKDEVNNLNNSGGFGAMAVAAGQALYDFGRNAVGAITGFINESRQAAKEAELNAAQLKAALNGNIEAYDRLIEQSAELQDKSIFSDDAIQQAQTALSIYGLTSQQIEEIIPKITDFASRTNQDIGAATDVVIKGLSGAEKGLKQYGFQLDLTAGQTNKNFNQISEGLNRFAGASAQVLQTEEGRAKRIANAWGDVQEVIGGRLGPAMEGVKTLFYEAAIEVVNFISPLKTTTELFEDQAKATEDLEKNINPLLDRYDVLKGKSKLTKDEQVELNKIITTIGETIPTAITQFGKYGEALDINSTKAREFIKTQKDYLQFINKEAIEDTENSIKEYQQRLSEIKGTLLLNYKEIQTRTGNAIKVPLNADEIKFYQSELSKFQKLVDGATESIKRLKGENLEDATKGVTKTDTGKEDPATDEEKKKAEARRKANEKLNDDLEKLREQNFVNELEGFAKEIQSIKANYEARRAEINRNDALTEEDKARHLTKLQEIEDKAIQNATDRFLRDVQKRSDALKVQLSDQQAALLTAYEQLLLTQQKEQVALEAKYDEQRRLAAGHYEALLLIQQDYQAESAALFNKQFLDRSEAEYKEAQRLFEQYITGLKAAEGERFTTGAIDLQTYNDEILALDTQLADGRKQLALDYAATSKQANADVTKDTQEALDAQVAASEEAAKKRAELLKGYKDASNLIASETLSFLGTVFDDIQRSEDERLAKAQKANEKQIELYKRQLETKAITQRQYDVLVNQLTVKQDEKERQVKKRQFERHKAYMIAQTIISTANAAINAIGAFASLGPVGVALGAAAAAAIGVFGAAQVALIARQDAPEELGKGGKLKGPKHKDRAKGMNVVDNQTGEVRQVVEGGEHVTNAAMSEKYDGLLTAINNDDTAGINKWLLKQPAFNKTITMHPAQVIHVTSNGTAYDDRRLRETLVGVQKESARYIVSGMAQVFTQSNYINSRKL
jgi:hypothetical protein